MYLWAPKAALSRAWKLNEPITILPPAETIDRPDGKKLMWSCSRKISTVHPVIPEGKSSRSPRLLCSPRASAIHCIFLTITFLLVSSIGNQSGERQVGGEYCDFGVRSRGTVHSNFLPIQGKGNPRVSRQLMLTFYQTVHEMPRVVLLPHWNNLE